MVTEAVEIISQEEVPEEKWIHVTAVFSRSPSRYQLYINGQTSTDTNDIHLSALTNNPLPVRIGCNNQGEHPFNGRIHRISIFTRTLDEGEIARLQDPLVPAHSLKDCVASWNLSEETPDRFKSCEASCLQLIAYGSTERFYYPHIESTDRTFFATDPRRSVYSERPAWHWHETFNTGNGTQGLMVWGNPHDEQIVCTHEKLFRPRHPLNIEPPPMASVMERMKALCVQGKFKEAADLAIQGAGGKGWDHPWPADSFHPALALRLQQSFEDKVTSYQRSLDMLTGEVTVRWTDAGGRFVRRAFVSRADNVFVIHVFSPDNQPVTCRLWLKDMGIINDRAYGHSPADIQLSGQWLTYRTQYTDFACPRGYEAALRILNPGGLQTLDHGKIKVLGAREILILGVVHDVDDMRFSSLDSIKAYIQKQSIDYNSLLTRHLQVHRKIMERVTLDLGTDIERHKLSAEQLISEQQAHSDRIDPVLLEKVFHLGRFSFIASSGYWPPALPGIWYGLWEPRWSGCFALESDLNLQVAQTNIGNIPEGMDAYTNLITSLVKDWRKNAKAVFDANGIVSGSYTGGRCGIKCHFGASVPRAFWTAGAPRLIHPLMEYYLVCGDEDYLKDTLFPLMKEIALFYEDFLTMTDKNGQVLFVPSFSPGTQGDPHGGAGINASLDLGVARDFFGRLISICRAHDWEKDNVPRWQALLDKIPPYRITPDGALAEWSWPDIPDAAKPAKPSALYGLYPAHDIAPDKDKDLFEAAKKAAYECLKQRPRGSVGDQTVSLGLAGARLKHGRMVKTVLCALLTEDYLLPSLFTLYDPRTNEYNLDVLHGLPAIVMEALVYSRPGQIEILPALPDGLDKGSIHGVLCRNQIRIDELAWDLNKGHITLKLTSQKDQTIHLVLRRGLRNIKVQNAHILHTKDTDAEVQLKKDVTATISIMGKAD
jgi:hypothetical protein